MGSGGSAAKKRLAVDSETATRTQETSQPQLRPAEALSVEAAETQEHYLPSQVEQSRPVEELQEPVLALQVEHKEVPAERTIDVRGSMEALPEAPAKPPSPEFSPVRTEEFRTQMQVAHGPDLLQEELLSSIDASPMSPPMKKPKKLELTARDGDESWKPILQPVLSTHPEDSPSQNELFQSFKDTLPPGNKSVMPETCQSPEIGRGKAPHAGDESLDEEVLRSIEGLPISPPRRHPGKLDLTESAGHELDSLLNLMDSK